MDTEFEAKILDIDVDTILSKLKSLGAKKIKEREQKRYVYDFFPKKDNSWVRLRTDGEETTLTIKEIQNDNIDGTEEIELEVSDFEKANFLLEKLGYSNNGYQENKRISYVLEGVQVEIDFWPLIPPYLEVEGNSEEEVEKIVKLLGYEISQTTSMNTIKVYKKYGIDLTAIKELKFE
ncbi:MAG: CYTH domain-containing protein [Candidatus Jacksonbacteria bacterium]|jgi:adenylate cyclase, class 2|nr:CYTH domain-containing protein [Candidatus Jacksonbacteria bacterium]MBT6034255.1 CYTH domain-containing protein [Candidatus Jacksonbacteria bacterium]MBT6301335.1 CYTH domain-containing protein [Candidatus Jacksonbacteria bacterium]MBT6756977.1 CYTH domain-containing protein [Candidatus Jacksonbacteria bacterium]MBT6955248.1 CYTH domain-containing protein [Candidatus Jacksonbacteria bacterium]